MRIHPESSRFIGPSWQVSGQGVREVLIREWFDAGAAVSRRAGGLVPGRGGLIRDWALNTSLAAAGDLFLIEGEARAAFARRQDATRLPADRRMRRSRELVL